MDTSLYPPSYQQKLLTLLSEEWDLDANTDGVLIHSDNFQALNLLQARYREQVKCIYIDPPYNTNASEIIYKNGYKHSSWLALMENRISKSISYLRNDGIINIAIDGLEFSRLECLVKDVVGEIGFISTIAIQHNPKGREKEHLADSHEYLIIASKNKGDAITYRLKLDQKSLNKKYGKVENNKLYRELPLRRSGSEAQREDRPYMYFPFLYNKNSLDLSLITDEEYFNIYKNDKFDDDFVLLLEDKYKSLGYYFVLPIRSDGSKGRWRWGYKSCQEGILHKSLFAKNDNGKISIYEKDFADDTFLPKTLWYGERYDASTKGTNLLKNIIPSNNFDYPKSIFVVEDAIKISSDQSALILDYFAGSGTTAHAVINLNREDGGNRKYILVEQGEYFDTVLKPRVQKVIYSENWKDGKPMPSEKPSDGFNGVSQIVKVLKLESYEDTLNNLELKGQADFIGGLPESVQEDYLLRYLLDVESKGSLLNSDDFKHPFDYCLNIATDSAGAYAKTNIDLVETFNYLLGLRVQRITDEREKRGYVMVEGALPNGDRCLIVWRDVEKMGYAEVAQFFNAQNINPNSDQYDVVYLNGDHDMASLWQNEDGSESRLSLRAIEPEFLRLMFAERGE